MKTLTQRAERAKETAIERQSKEMVERYGKADASERQAIIGQIDSFIPALRLENERKFWLDFKRKLIQKSV